ncbi:RagB/SusD family nutrient uptake outer membrane protein [Parapedobacter tibetensis]|uniref:RagB/SusD family nutrient uptake outer membrane protein n=1 Tax=Parapedobacter tibetensis TaxID=2972951 RepID=UPI00214DD2BD|nr:RagB/SusD family nutrient uptake outer membrane protein [Parapedobacter tibetensis]
MKIAKLFLCLISCYMLGACSKWIDVKPTDRLSEELLFSDRDGFLKALNGVYIEMANRSLYGQEMSAGTIDVLAQYYYIPDSRHRYREHTVFDYLDDFPKSTFDNVWSKVYELIANCNVILEHCDAAPSEFLPAPYYGIVKGETLALRAMLHLDMLRLFGPIWSEANKSVISIPYVAQTGFEVSPLLSAEEIMQHIIVDLTMALSLLESTDPIRTEGVRHTNNPTGSNELYYRQYRLNYYAAKALLARTYLWQGDKASALEQAEALLAEVQVPGAEIFPFVTFAAATHAERPDRMFSTEVMFALYDVNRVNMFNALFAAALNPFLRLSFNGGNTNESRVIELYDDANDYRRRIWQNVTSGTETTLTNLKYQDIPDANTPGRYMIPLIRISEVLLIAAECSPTLQEGIAYLNQVRTSRNCFDVVPTDDATLKAAITREFRKEVIGEGQQFYYFKRNAMQVVPNNGALVGTKTMVLNNYVVPLPDSEVSQRNDLN